MSCEEKTRLLREYEAATAAFSTAVTELHRRTPYHRQQSKLLNPLPVT